MAIGFGSTFSNAAVSGTPSWTTVAGVVDIKAPGIKTDFKDATSNDSANGVRVYDIGLADWEACTVSFRYTSAVYTTLVGLIRTAQMFKITLPDSKTFIWTGALENLSLNDPLEDEVMIEATFRKTTGTVAFA